jgi:hypothetical protein
VNKALGVFVILMLSISLPAAAVCISPVDGADHAQQIMNELNAGRSAVLCPSTLWYITHSVFIPDFSTNLSIYTEGYPTGTTRAMLYLVSSTTSAAIRAGEGAVNFSLRNIHVNGGGSLCESGCHGEGLIWLGGKNTSGYLIQNVKVSNARTWTHLVIERGPEPSCTGARILDSEFGPAFFGYSKLVDGISMQCRDSEIARNTITDVTDGGIVVFGAPGTYIHDNTININGTRAISGVAMTDNAPWSMNVVDVDTGQVCSGGDFRGTRVENNTINSGNYIKVGIAMGRRLDGSCHKCDNVGGTVKYNNVTTSGTGKLGYSYMVDGVRDWTVLYNTTSAVHGGSTNNHCGVSQPGAAPMLIHWAHADVLFAQPMPDLGPMHGFDITK